VSESLPITRTLHFDTPDGVDLVGDLALPATPTLAAIVCHPHPQYGGNRFNNVVTALHEALPGADVAALRFDFRSEFSGGPGERVDAIAALDVLAREVPGVPLVALGYSFGAMIALGLDDDRVTALGLVAPPLAMAPDAGAPRVRTLVLTPAHDQFSPPSASAPIVSRWGPIADHRTIEMADHSLVGHTATVADQIVRWLRPPPPEE
jgi:alpha/beta superfamily hydrolase